jgi:ribosome-associated protein
MRSWPSKAAASKKRMRTLSTAKRVKGKKAQKLPDQTFDPGLADVEATLKKILGTLDNAKAEQVVSIPLKERSTIADFMVVASGRSQRHVDAIAAQLLDALAKMGKIDVRVEGRPNCDWVVIDEGDVIVHLFHPDLRTFYNLEKMWSPARPTERSAA